jgi:TonB family protein
VLPRVLGPRAGTSSATASPGRGASASSATSEPERAAPTASARVPEVTKSAEQPAATSASKTGNEKKSSEAATSLQETSPAPASLRTEPVPSPAASLASTGSPGHGEILDQVLPQVSEKALATIQGTVRVSVLLQVDAAGNVSQAEFDSPGPSKYFADLALNASRRWEFTSPEADGHSVPSQWRVRFEFTPSGVKAFPKQIAP